MDFTPNPEIERFRERLRAWLARHQPARDAKAYVAGEGDDAERIAFLKRWQRALFEAGFLAVHWPKDCGGQGLSLLHHIAANEELVRAAAPPLINGPSISISGPTLLACGTPEQRRRYLPKLLSADEIWCLGFSEPNAGSDLASLRTVAVRDGDDFVINGQKVWTTYGHMADFGLFLVRTDPGAPKHKGISCLIVPMRSPGITVRPLREMTGDHDFNEVFLEDVRVPAANLVGEPNRGWQVILTALGHERGTLVVVDRVRLKSALDRIVTNLGADPEKRLDARVRQRIAQSYIETEIQGLHAVKILGDLEQHRPPTESSILKLFGSEVAQRLWELGLGLQGPYGLLFADSKHVREAGSWQHAHLMSFSLTIASGTSEVQRNIIAERLLGLPHAG
jgi:alkylation response protein AidB-like acyl-CoA dehydrogenase